MIKGVPEELQAAYNLNPQQFDLLGVMADAADEAGEGEVGECLRFLWKHRQVPVKWGGYGWFDWGADNNPYLHEMPAIGKMDTPIKAVLRVLTAWPLHKHLLIDALEKENVT